MQWHRDPVALFVIVGWVVTLVFFLTRHGKIEVEIVKRYVAEEVPAPEPAPVSIARLVTPLNASEHEALSQKICFGHGYYVYNSPQPWCICDFGWEGNACAHPYNRTVRGAVVILAYGQRAYFDEIFYTLPTLEKHWVPTTPDADLIIFTQRGMANGEDLDRLQKLISWRVIIEEVYIDIPANPSLRATIPEGSSMMKEIHMTCKNRHWRLGYAVMNSFFSFQIYSEPILTRYDYWLRIDSHLHPTIPFPCHIFRTMAASKAAMFHAHANSEETSDCRGGLLEVAHDYVHRNNFSAHHVDYVNPWTFSGALAGFNMRFWGHPEVLRYLHTWHESAWIYKSRAADQALWPIVCAMFLPSEKVHQFGYFPKDSLRHRGERIYHHSMRSEPDEFCTQ